MVSRDGNHEHHDRPCGGCGCGCGYDFDCACDVGLCCGYGLCYGYGSNCDVGACPWRRGYHCPGPDPSFSLTSR